MIYRVRAFNWPRSDSVRFKLCDVSGLHPASRSGRGKNRTVEDACEHSLAGELRRERSLIRKLRRFVRQMSRARAGAVA